MWRSRRPWPWELAAGAAAAAAAGGGAGADRSVSLPARAVVLVLMEMPIANNRSSTGSHSRCRLLVRMFALPCICSLLTRLILTFSDRISVVSTGFVSCTCGAPPTNGTLPRKVIYTAAPIRGRLLVASRLKQDENRPSVTGPTVGRTDRSVPAPGGNPQVPRYGRDLFAPPYFNSSARRAREQR